MRKYGWLLAFVVLLIVIWFAWEYSQLNNKTKLIVGDYLGIERNMVAGDDSGAFDIRGFYGVYLGDSKLDCGAVKDHCVWKHKFVSLDLDGNPIVFWIYGGSDFDSSGVRVFNLDNSEDGIPIITVDNEKFINRIEHSGLVELVLVCSEVSSELLRDFSLENEEVLNELQADQSGKVNQLLQLMQDESLNSGSRFIRSFFLLRKTILPVVFVGVEI